MSNITTRGGLRFGVFEVDLDARELRKRGIRIKLQDKPFDVLEALLEKSGAFVTREELRDRLWADEAPTDVNRNLNKAINKLRNALGDSTESPRFVETKPRLGYRFLASVETLENRFDLQTVLQAAPSPVSVELPPSLEPPLSWRLRPIWILAAAVAALVALALILLFFLGPSDPLRIVGSRQLTNDAIQKIGEICTDGRHIYFSEFRDGRVRVAQVPATGGETSFVETPFDPPVSVFALDVTRDGQQLLIKTGSGVNPEINRDPLWILSPTTGAARRLSDLTVNDARWSPNGKQIAYFADDQLFLAAADGSSPRLTARKPGLNSDICWSPDGSRLRFRSAFPGRYYSTIWEVRADGSHLRQVFPNWENEQQFGDWASDGKHFVFYSPTDFKLWLGTERWRPFGSSESLAKLNSGPMRFVHPRLDPDRGALFTIGEIRRGELLRWNAGSGQFEPYRSGLSADQLDFSRSGGWVTYVSFPENGLWRSRSDGTHRLQLTFPPMQVYLPRYSPDGKQIAFMGRLPKARWRIYLVPAEGGTPRQMLPGEGTESDPNWSPDGKRIVYAPFPWEVDASQTGIRIFDLATQRISLVAGSQQLFSPRWSPGGRHMFALHADGQPRLFDFETGAWTTFPFLGGFPAWSRDGQFVYVFHAFTEERGIYRFEIRTRRAEKVASLQDIDVAGILGPYGLSLAPDDSPLVLRDLSIQEIYAFDLN